MWNWLDPLILSTVTIVGLYGTVAYLIVFERLIAAFRQDGTLPGWTGGRGLLRPLRDGVSLLFRRRTVSSRSDARMTYIGAVVLLSAATLAFATIPIGLSIPVGERSEAFPAAGLDFGLLLVLSMYGLSVFGLVLHANTAAELRRGTRLMSHGIPLGLSALGVVLVSGSLRLDAIVAAQAEAGVWWIAVQPLGCAVFVAAALSFTARPGTNMRDSEFRGPGGCDAVRQMFPGVALLAEYLHIIAVAYLLVLLFFGGWHLWGVAPAAGIADVTYWGALLRFGSLHLKVVAVITCVMWLRQRWSGSDVIPLLEQSWKALIPLGLVNLVVTAACHELLSRRAFLLSAAVGWCVLATCLWVMATLCGRGYSMRT